MYQVKWFNKKKGYGFATSEKDEELFCHHTDLKVDGYKYLKRGEFVRAEGGWKVQVVEHSTHHG